MLGLLRKSSCQNSAFEQCSLFDTHLDFHSYSGTILCEIEEEENDQDSHSPRCPLRHVCMSSLRVCLLCLGRAILHVIKSTLEQSVKCIHRDMLCWINAFIQIWRNWKSPKEQNTVLRKLLIFHLHQYYTQRKSTETIKTVVHKHKHTKHTNVWTE